MTRPQCNAQPARTHDGSIWGCSNYVRRALLAADGRTGPQPRNAPRVTHMLPLPVSFHIGDDPPTGDVSLRPARPLPLTNYRPYEGSMEERLSCGNRATPAFVILRSWKPPVDHRGHGERHLPVVAFVKRSSPRGLPRPSWKRRYQVSAIIKFNERINKQLEAIVKAL